MNSDPEKLRALLDEVLPTSGERCGPSSAEVLNMLLHERQRCRRLHSSVVLLSIIVVTVVSLHWNHQRSDVAPVAQATVDPASSVIHPVNDEQLFALLGETPAALLKLPNGESILLVIEQ